MREDDDAADIVEEKRQKQLASLLAELSEEERAEFESRVQADEAIHQREADTTRRLIVATSLVENTTDDNYAYRMKEDERRRGSGYDGARSAHEFNPADLLPPKAELATAVEFPLAGDARQGNLPLPSGPSPLGNRDYAALQESHADAGAAKNGAAAWVLSRDRLHAMLEACDALREQHGIRAVEHPGFEQHLARERDTWIKIQNEQRAADDFARNGSDVDLKQLKQSGLIGHMQLMERVCYEAHTLGAQLQAEGKGPEHDILGKKLWVERDAAMEGAEQLLNQIGEQAAAIDQLVGAEHDFAAIIGEGVRLQGEAQGRDELKEYLAERANGGRAGEQRNGQSEGQGERDGERSEKGPDKGFTPNDGKPGPGKGGGRGR